MTEHLSDGKFARKEVSATETVVERGPRGKFAKGHKKLGGRPPGGQNKVTRDYKEFLALLVNDFGVQEGIKAKIERGDTVGFFRALEHIAGKPVERVEVSGTLNIEARLTSARDRLAKRG